ncbi:MAG: 1-deoxy-D-xylulose-5-phosphate synthase, partial [Clostridia bacterium]|nr:1-deoxy-D-xylulose-5-phosphate synthase [Clostridia bacterium]
KIKKNVNEPCLLHVYTKKGKGYEPAEKDAEAYHSVYVGGDKAGELPASVVVEDEMRKLLQADKRVVAISAAMQDSVGLKSLASLYPQRIFDVGIAESHAVTFAGGLAAAGKKPYVLIYSTFLQRAYDQILHDVAISNLPVTFLLDRAGFCGADGKTHQGLQDLSYLSNIPNLTVWTPATTLQLKQMLEKSQNFGSPLAIRYSKSLLDNDVIGFDYDGWNVLSHGSVKLLAVGKNMLQTAINLSQRYPVEVVSVTSVKPLDERYLAKITSDDVVITLEENQLSGGFGSLVAQRLINVGCKVVNCAVDDTFVAHGSVADQLTDCNLDQDTIEEVVCNCLSMY